MSHRMRHKSTPITLNESRTSHECVTNEPRMNLECVCVTNESQILSIFNYYEKQDSVVGVRGFFAGTQGFLEDLCDGIDVVYRTLLKWYIGLF